MKSLQVIFFAAIYVLSPIDLAPEIVLGPLGLADDFIVILIAIRQLTKPKLSR